MAITYTGGEIQVNSGKDSGTATSGTATTLTAAKAWATNQFVDYIVWITGGTGVGQSRKIVSNTGTVMTVSRAWNTVPSAGSTFVILYRLSDIYAALPTYLSLNTYRFASTAVNIHLLSGGALSLFRETLSFTVMTTFLLTDTGSYFQAGDAVSNTFYEKGTEGGQLIAIAPGSYWEIKMVGKAKFYGCSIDTKRTATDAANAYVRINLPQNGFVSTGLEFYDCTLAGIMPQLQSVDKAISVNAYPHGTTTVGADTGLALYGTPEMKRCNIAVLPRAEYSGYTINGGDVIDHTSIQLGSTYDFFLYDFCLSLGGCVYFWNTTITNNWTSIARWYFDYAIGASGDGHIYRGYLVGISVRDALDAPVQGALIGVLDKNNVGGILTSKGAYKIPVRSASVVSNASGTYIGTVGVNEGLPVLYAKYVSSDPTTITDAATETLYAPFTFKVRRYGYYFIQKSANYTERSKEQVTLMDNVFIAVLEAVASSYTGITADNTSKTIVLSAPHSVQHLYDYLQWWSATDVTRDEALTTSDGINTTLTTYWKLTADGFVTWDKSVSGGTVKFSAAGTYSPRVGTTTLEFGGAGTYNLSGANITGTVTLVNTSGGAVTVNLAPGVTYVNNGPLVTVVQISGATLTLVGLQPGSDVVILAAGTSTVLASVDANAGSSWAYTYTSAQSVDIYVIKPGYEFFSIVNYSLGSVDASVPVSQRFDRNYS